MATASISITTEELSRELLCEGYTKKIECKNYWDAHGKRIEYEPTQYNFDCEKKFEIWKVIIKTHYQPINLTHQSEWWYIYVDGERLSPGEIMGYNILKTKLKLDVCVGAG